MEREEEEEPLECRRRSRSNGAARMPAPRREDIPERASSVRPDPPPPLPAATLRTTPAAAAVRATAWA